MNFNLDGILNYKTQIIVSLVIFSLFVGLSCASAAAVSSTSLNDKHVCHDKVTLSVKYNAGTGYHWEVSPKSHGVTFLNHWNVQDHPRTTGSSGTSFFTFKIDDDDYFAELVLISPTGKVVDHYDSNMLQ